MFIKIDFPSGCYYAAQKFNAVLPEWPPHPGRLFSAMVASAYQSGGGMTDQKRKALEWLESMPAPRINAPKADIAEAPISYVPQADLTKKDTHGVLRLRQARHFPNAVILGAPTLYYGWEEDPETEMLSTLDEIAFGVTHVGTSHSIAIVTVSAGEMPVPAIYTPDSKGSEFLDVATAGRLKELDEVFLFKDGIRRPSPVCELSATYRKGRKGKNGTAPQYELIPIRLPGITMAADCAGYIGRALRRAVMSKLGDDAPEPVHGHSHIDHVGWLCLPDVGHPYARGRIVGMAVAFPGCLSEDERQQIRSALSRIDSIRLDDGRDVTIDFLRPDFIPPRALQLRTWTRPSSVWATVTPVVLDRPPKKSEHKRLCRAVAESVLNAGYPAPVEVDVSPFSYFAGSPPAFTVPSKKPRYHATIRFESPVAGPVIAGRLRYFGVGLFRPVQENQQEAMSR